MNHWFVKSSAGRWQARLVDRPNCRFIESSCFVGLHIKNKVIINNLLSAVYYKVNTPNNKESMSYLKTIMPAFDKNLM